jgi:hypothetical protein
MYFLTSPSLSLSVFCWHDHYSKSNSSMRGLWSLSKVCTTRSVGAKDAAHRAHVEHQLGNHRGNCQRPGTTYSYNYTLNLNPCGIISGCRVCYTSNLSPPTRSFHRPENTVRQRLKSVDGLQSPSPDKYRSCQLPPPPSSILKQEPKGQRRHLTVDDI